MHRLSWDTITSEERIPRREGVEAKKYRSEIESDYHRIIRSASFRRLQDKTQVFPLDKSDFVRTRLTHSLEVSSIAKFIGKQVCNQISEQKLEDHGRLPDALKVTEILNCAGLLHDIGNPPFGHFGEFAIRAWFRKNLPIIKYKDKTLAECLDEQEQADLLYFEGNAQTLRIITKLHRLTGNNGMHLTSSVMDTIIKYPVNSIQSRKAYLNGKNKPDLLHKKIGYYKSETEQFMEIKNNTGTFGCRNPLCFILEAADDLAYTFADLEDGYKKGLYSYDALLDLVIQSNDIVGAELLMKSLEEGKSLVSSSEKGFDPYLHAVFSWLTKKQLFCISGVSDAFIENYDAIMNGEFCEELIARSKEGILIGALKKFAYHKVYNDSAILKLELMGNEIVSFLLDRFVNPLVLYDSGEPMSEIQDKYIDLLSRNYLNNYHMTSKGCSDHEKLYLRLLLATDFISGMSDSYAKQLYQELRGI